MSDHPTNGAPGEGRGPWLKVLEHGELPEGRVKPASCESPRWTRTRWRSESSTPSPCRCGARLEPHSAGLRDALGERRAAVDPRSEIAARWDLWRAEKASRRGDDRGRGLASAVIFDALTRNLPEDAIIAVDVGNKTYSFGRYFECTRQAVLMSGYLGSIGFALPAALGAWAATQEQDTRFRGRKVVSISGDGGFAQYMGEWLTAAKYELDITHVLLRNDELGKISKEQRAGNWEVWQTSLHNPSFAEYAELAGTFGREVRDAQSLETALPMALAHRGPALVEIVSDAELI